MRPSERGGPRGESNQAAWWVLLLSVVCCASLALVLLASGAGLASAGAWRDSTWLVIAGIVVIAIALVWWRTRVTRHRRDHA